MITINQKKKINYFNYFKNFNINVYNKNLIKKNYNFNFKTLFINFLKKIKIFFIIFKNFFLQFNSKIKKPLFLKFVIKTREKKLLKNKVVNYFIIKEISKYNIIFSFCNQNFKLIKNTTTRKLIKNFQKKKLRFYSKLIINLMCNNLYKLIEKLEMKKRIIIILQTKIDFKIKQILRFLFKKKVFKNFFFLNKILYLARIPHNNFIKNKLKKRKKSYRRNYIRYHNYFIKY